MVKIINPGKTEYGELFLRLELANGVFNCSGVEGPLADGNCKGSCGQCLDALDRLIGKHLPNELVRQLGYVWRRWHLNNMRAGCEHQRKAGWDQIPIDPDKPLDAYGKFAGDVPTWNMAIWVYKKDHPAGLLMEPCPECGYRYGSQWLREPLPENFQEWFDSLPETQRKPAWV